MTNRILKLRVESRAPTGATALLGLRALSSAVERAIERVAPEDEVIVLRRVDLSLVAHLDERDAGRLEAALGDSIAAKIAAQLGELRAKAESSSALVTADMAWFASVGVHWAERMIAVREHATPPWPFEALDAGSGWRELLAMTRSELTRALAHLATARRTRPSHDRPDHVLGVDAPPATTLAAILARCTASVEGHAVPDLELPDDVIAAIRDQASGDGDAAMLERLAALYARWPPARDRPVPRALLAPQANDPAPRSSTVRTEAAGLVLLAAHLRDTLNRLVAGYDDERARRAFLVALGVALEDARLRLDDPILALFAGERPSAAGLPLGTLAAFDPEPAHASAVRIALEGPEVELSVAPIGETVLAFSGGILVDEARVRSSHDAIPELVARFARRTGHPPSAVSVLDRCPDAVIDRLTEVDAPRLPDAWRPATRCAASLVAERITHDLARTLREIRSWPGRLERLPSGEHRLALSERRPWAQWPEVVELRGGRIVVG